MTRPFVGRRICRPFGELAPTADWQGWQFHDIASAISCTRQSGAVKQQERRVSLPGEGPPSRHMDLGTDLNIHGAHGVKKVFDQIEEADFARGKLDSEQLLDAIVYRVGKGINL